MRVWVLLLSLFAYLAGLGFGSETSFSIRVINRTGYALVKLYIAPTSRPSWGRNLLREGGLLDTESIHIVLTSAGNRERFFDIMGVDTDGDRYLQSGVDLSKISTVVITFRDFLEPRMEGWDWEEYFEEDENGVVKSSGKT